MEFEKAQKIAAAYNAEQSEFWGNLVVTVTKPFLNVWRRDWYDSVKFCQFENILMPAPAGMEARLQKQYGDWMTLPSVESRGQWHSGVILDVNCPYTKYV